MDTDRELNDRRVDDALQHLFQEAGHTAPSDGFDQRILNRIAVMAAPGKVRDVPLVPKYAWVLGGLLLAAVVAWALTAPASGGGYFDDLLHRAPRIQPGIIRSSPWVLLAAVAGALLFGLDALLTRRTLARASAR